MTIARATVKLVLALAACALLLGAPLAVDAHGASTGDQARLAQTRARLQHAQEMIDQAKAREADLGAQVAAYDAKLNVLGDELARLDGQIAKVLADLKKAHKKLAVTRADLKAKRAQLRETEAELKAQQERFEQHVVLTYKNGDVSYLDVLLGSGGFEDLVSRLQLVRTLVGSDNLAVGDLQTLRERVDEQRAALVADEQTLVKAEGELSAQRDRLAALRADAAAKRAGLAEARAGKAGALHQVATTRAAWERQEAALQAESNRIAAAIAGAGSTGHGTGELIWPVSGPITSPFGWRIHPIWKTRMFHAGIDIGAGAGVPIAAADSGAVIESSYNDASGYYVIISHGGGLATVYCHMSAHGIAAGTSVHRGQTIGNVGATGWATGPHLHFEVRVNGTPVNPLGYLP